MEKYIHAPPFEPCSTFSKTQQVLFFHDMLRIRRLQEHIDADYLKNEMYTPVHLCIGQDATAVGVYSALRKDDLISSNHQVMAMVSFPEATDSNV